MDILCNYTPSDRIYTRCTRRFGHIGPCNHDLLPPPPQPTEPPPPIDIFDPFEKARSAIAILSDKKWVAKTPLVTVLLLEYANVGQLWRMWHERTAAGQSLWSWISVNLALWLWLNFYRVMLPNDKTAFRATCVGIALNTAVILSVIYFRYLA